MSISINHQRTEVRINKALNQLAKVNDKYAALPNTNSTNKNELSITAINFYLDHLVKTKVIGQV